MFLIDISLNDCLLIALSDKCDCVNKVKTI